MIRFTHEIRTPDGGGEVAAIATTPDEKWSLLKSWDSFRAMETAEEVIAAADLLRSSEPLIRKSYDPKRPWFRVEAQLSPEWTAPYLKALQRRTGYEGPGPESLDLLPALNTRANGMICPTNLTEKMTLNEDWSIDYIFLVQSQDWNGKPAATRAIEYAADLAQDDVGDRRHESEWLENERGIARRNPNYLKHYPCHPAAIHDWLWKPIFEWWLAAHANPAQREFVARHRASLAKHRFDDSFTSLKAYNVTIWEPRPGPNNYEVLSFEQFSRLGEGAGQ